MSSAHRLAVIALVTAATGVGVAAGSPASVGAPPALVPSNWCSDQPAPCIESVTHDGTPVPKTDPTFQVQLADFGSGYEYMWNLMESGDYDLTSAAAGAWTVVLDTGAVVPRVVYGIGQNGDVSRIDDGDGTWHVSTTAHPTLVAQGCDNSSVPWTCPTNAVADKTFLAAEVTAWDNWTDVTQRKAFFGVDFWTNIEVNSFPPNVFADEATNSARMVLDVAAPHFLSDGTTEYHGHFEMVLPNDFLHENFFIPSPTTMTPASLAVGGGGPVSTTTVTKASPSDPVVIRISDITFSKRRLEVSTGTIVPTRPGNLVARRTTTHAGRLSYDLAKARGARVTGYQARCVPAHGDSVTGSVKGNASPLKVTGLRSGTAYSCRVRATSKAGHGPWSAKSTLRARP
ncbi:fibronectin type III domain-containing protein [Nocardioides taihuensis]|uniref:Fibronectin type III domain-containing protein n=1 Tax=Nocardioides taihuensis TaxID=1835606 RepID=A0ABW0BQS6_9ACTN